MTTGCKYLIQESTPSGLLISHGPWHTLPRAQQALYKLLDKRRKEPKPAAEGEAAIMLVKVVEELYLRGQS